MKKRILSIVLTLAMVLSLFPAAIFASEDGGATVKEVADFAALEAELKKGGEIKLTADIVAEGTLTVPAGVTATLDLNGKTVSGTCDSGQAHLIMIENTATLNVKDTSANAAGKITYAQGSSNVGWTIDLEGNLNLYSGTIELTGSWSIGYAVDVRPNSWGSEYTEGTVFHMFGGKLVSSDGAVRVASSSADGHKNVSASFVMDGGEIESVYDGLFVQQSNAAWDILNVTINNGTISSPYAPVRFYGPVATSTVGGVETAITVEINGGTIKYTGGEELSGTWLVDKAFKYGGGMTADDFAAKSSITISGGTFSGNVSKYCVPGLKSVKDEATGLYVMAPSDDAVAAIGAKGYMTLADAIANAKDGDTVTLLQDAKCGETHITENITIDLNKNTVTATGNRLFRIMEGAKVTFKNGTIQSAVSAGRCIETRAGGIDLLLENVVLETTGTGWTQPFTVGGSGEGITVTITNSEILAGPEGYAITTFNPVNMSITNSTVTGYAALNIKAASGSVGSNGSKFTVTDSVLNGINRVPGAESNSFSTIMIEVPVTISIEGGELNAVETNANDQWIFAVGNEYIEKDFTGVEIKISGNAKVTYEGDKLLGFGKNVTAASTSFSVTGGTFASDAVKDYLADGYSVAKTDAGYVVKAPEKVETEELPKIEVENAGTVTVEPPVVVVEPTVGEVKAEDAAAAEALADAVANIEVEADKIAVEQVGNITAEEIAAAVEELKDKGATITATTDVTVETKISLNVENAGLVSTENTGSILTVNITPMVTTKVSAAGESVEKTKKAEVTVPVTVTIPLPAGYFQAGQKLTVVHTKDNGEKYTHVVTVQEKNGALVVEFLNENGFSLFSFAPAYAVIDPIANANVADLPAVIAAYYDEIYEVAYYYADSLGYVDVAVDGLEIALDSLDIAKDYVNANAPAEYEAVKVEMLKELDNTKATLVELIALLENDDLATVDSLIAEVLGLEEELWAHLDTLKDLAYELGLEIDPYIIKLNDAVVAYGELVDATIVEAYNTLVETVEGFENAYVAWVEKMGAAADQISPELGAAVRKFFNDSAADAVAIVAAYGEEAIFELFDVVGDAAGDIVDVALNLADVMAQHGLTIYEAVKDNTEVQELLAAVKNQLAEVEALVKEIAQMKTGAVINAAIVADKEALLQAAYDELVVLYNELTEVLYSVIDDVDEEAAAALDAALTALCDTLCITYNAADGYLGWLAGRADAMACEILCAVLDNLIELVVTASPIMDQWMYDWLYNNPEEVIAFFIENEAEIDALVAKYGPCVVAVLGYVANTYGPEVLDFIIENPCEALDMFMDWYNKYGYRIWPMIDVYLEALGVYDAIDEQLGIVNDKIMAMLSELDAHILAQIAALKAALLDASEELRAQIEAEIQALYEQLMAFLKANISAKYVVGPNSYYVALGDAGAYGPAADKLAAELGMTDKYANLTFADASAGEVLANLNAAEIAKADLITLGFGANTFTAAVAADVMNAAFGEIVAKDWAALAGEEGAAAIEAALVELTAYVAEEVGDESVAALLTAAVESFAYTYINHLVDYVVVSEAIHEINADALLVLVGMHNPMDGVVIDLDGEELDLGEYLNYLVMLTNIYSFGYALIAEDTIYVDAPAVETNYDGAVMDIMTFVSDLLGFEEAVVKYQPTDAGYKYIQEQIYNALNPTLYEEEEACQHGVLGSLKFQWAGDYSACVAVYTCSICGEAFTKDCLVEVEIVKQPTAEETGLAKYTATAEFFGKEYSETKEVVLPKLDTPDTGDTAMIGLYVTVMLFAAAGAVVVLKKKKHA